MLLALPGLAQRPEDTVRELYQSWIFGNQSHSGDVQFWKAHRLKLVPELYSGLLEAYGTDNSSGVPFPGIDVLCGVQVEVFGFELGQTRVQEDTAEVDIFVRTGLTYKLSKVRGRKVILSRRQDGWKLENVIYEQGADLRRELEGYLDSHRKR
jgi:hypothetical protein